MASRPMADQGRPRLAGLAANPGPREVARALAAFGGTEVRAPAAYRAGLVPAARQEVEERSQVVAPARMPGDRAARCLRLTPGAPRVRARRRAEPRARQTRSVSYRAAAARPGSCARRRRLIAWTYRQAAVATSSRAVSTRSALLPRSRMARSSVTARDSVAPTPRPVARAQCRGPQLWLIGSQQSRPT